MSVLCEAAISYRISQNLLCAVLVHEKNVKVIGNVKCMLLQVLRLCTGRTAHRGSRGIALLLGKGKVNPCTGTEALYRLYGS